MQVAELRDLDLLLLDDGHCLRDQIVDLCRHAHVNPAEATNSVTRASSLTTIMQLVMGGLGCTLIPKSALATECHGKNLGIAYFDPEVTAEREIGLAFRSSAARSEEFREFGTLITAAYENALARSLED